MTMKSSYEAIVDVEHIASHHLKLPMAHYIALGKAEALADAAADRHKTLLLAIDVQQDFMEPAGSLAVPGSQGDVARLTRWMYANLAKLSRVICSLDTHSIQQIFHADWWKDAAGNPPAPFTIITAEDVLAGIWLPRAGTEERSLHYLQKLAEAGQKQLCIWPYHCLEGTPGAALEGEFMKMLYFHAAARNSKPLLLAKGQDPFTEMYGIIQAEYDPSNTVNQEVLDAVASHDAIYIAGEASSHCVLASVSQILAHYAERPDITSRITVLVDCMSPIAGFEEATAAQFAKLRDTYGIQLCDSTDLIL